MNQRQRAILYAAVAVVLVWVIALVGFAIAKNSRMTAEKIRVYVESVDLSKLSAAERAKAIQRLADKLNRLSVEERRKAQIGRAAERWFEQMTEEEKGQFIDATMPTGFKQMITAFEQMPEDRRRRAVEESLKRLREVRSQMSADELPKNGGTNREPELSPELQAKVRTIGLKSFYSQSSAQTKAELAPLLEELQRVMESGRLGRGERR